MFIALKAYCTEETFAQNSSSDIDSNAVIKCIIETAFITSSTFLSLHSLYFTFVYSAKKKKVKKISLMERDIERRQKKSSFNERFLLYGKFPF
jgi:hypothetical protein